jgi:diguanylate cyclase (GGDEF)-like protein
MTLIRNWVLGPEPTRERVVGMTFLVGLLHLFNAGLMQLAVHTGHAHANAGHVLSLYLVVGGVMSYALVRLDWPGRPPDSALVMALAAHAMIVVALCYLSVDVRVRGVVLTFMPAILLPCQFVLSPVRLWQLSLVGSLALLSVSFLSRLLFPETADVAGELIRWLYVTGILAAAAFAAQTVNKLYRRALAQSESLALAMAQLREMASHDQLTNLLNRRRMNELLDMEWQRVQRTRHPTTLIMMDLDHFKRVNDNFGHQAGDDVLQGFSNLAQASLRSADALSRWGGEEFLVLCPETSPDQAVLAMKRLQGALKTTPLIQAHPEFFITFSAGVATLRPGESMASAIERADQALYRAKNEGRDRTVVDP